MSATVGFPLAVARSLDTLALPVLTAPLARRPRATLRARSREGGVPTEDRELIRRALLGEVAALRELVDRLSPTIQSRVARALCRRRAQASGRDVRQEVEDMTQEVFVSLLESNGRALRAWEPDRGLSLAGFAGFLAERQVASILRTGRRSPWTEDPTLQEELDVPGRAADGPEPAVASRELLERLLDRLREELSPKGLQLFHALMVEQRSVEQLVAETGMTADALYAWRSRLAKRVRKLAVELDAEAEAPPSRPALSLVRS